MNTKKKINKNIVLFIGAIAPSFLKDIKAFSKKNKRNWNFVLLYDLKNISERGRKSISERVDLDEILSCDMSSQNKLAKTLLPYRDKIISATCAGPERYIPSFRRVIPNLPYIKLPTSTSLHWATHKLDMRKRFFAYDKNITPDFAIVHDVKKESLKKIEEKIKFPLVVKPAGLGASLLVSICYHREELEKVLKNIFKKINKLYKESNKKSEITILVERFMEGKMYSVDAYVNSRGKVYFCPFVHIKTGRSIGFDDFFGYRQITPTLLKTESIKSGENVAKKAIHALGLRSVTAHIELIKTEDGWKIVEVGPRIGGFRHKMYKLSYGINHLANDILNHIPEKPIIPRKIKGHTASMKFFAKKEGKLMKLTGVKKLEELKSFKEVKVNKKLGDMCRFAKNGGKSVFDIILFNKNRSDLLADIRRLEQMIEIVTK